MSGAIDTNETNDEIDVDEVFVLKKDEQSYYGKGAFFLAVMAGLMCISQK